VDPATEKRRAFASARQLLSDGDDSSLRYAALEIRRCVEAIVYEKLLTYRDRLPTNVLRKWQPPQAFKALLAVEPDADTTASLGVAVQEAINKPASGPIQIIGTDHRPRPQWLSKTWNKLGSFLHAEWPFAEAGKEPTPANIRDFLVETMSALEVFVDVRSISFQMANLVTFECTECGTTVKANVAGIIKTGAVACLNTECECQFSVTELDSPTPLFVPDIVKTACPGCGKEIRLPRHRVGTGYRYSCRECTSTFEITNVVQWECRKVEA